MPLLVTVIVHVVLIGAAAAIVVQQTGGGKKKTFEASNQVSAAPAVEHRLQVARRGGASGGASSPVSANRIFSTAENALQMPSMPDLPSMGAGGFGGFGGMGSGVGLGAGVGMATSLGGGTGLGGRGFMSLNFLGMTDQRSSKIVFAVDISPSLMDIRKGGFRAFEIMRIEISRLIAALPLSNEFNVILFDGRQIRLFAAELQPANSAAKTAFFEWIKPINASLENIGGGSIPSTSPRWNFKRDEALNLDPEFGPSQWIQAVHAALEQKPDTVFVITGSAGIGQKRLSDETIARRRANAEKARAELLASGFDYKAIEAARGRAVAKLRAEFDDINRKLVAAKKDPLIIVSTMRILDADMQAAIRKAGHKPPVLDTTGWTDKEGKPIWTDFSFKITTSENAEFSDLLNHVARLQAGLLRERAALNIFLFTGPEAPKADVQKNLSTLASRNGGKFSLLTTKRLEELTAQAEAAAKAAAR